MTMAMAQLMNIAHNKSNYSCLNRIIHQLLLFSLLVPSLVDCDIPNELPTFAVPLRDARVKAKARACVSTYGDKAARSIFLHNRKAGGTTIRKWLGHQQICQHHFIGFVEEAMVMNVSRLSEKGTVFVTGKFHMLK